MATPRALAIRREAAAGRIDTALLGLANHHAVLIDDDALHGVGRDADLAHTRQLEAFADILEQLISATAFDATPPTVTPLVIDGVEYKHIEALAAHGLTTLEQIRAADDHTLLSVHGIGPATLDRIRDWIGAHDAK